MLGHFVLALSVIAVSASPGTLVLPVTPPAAPESSSLLACPTGDIPNFYCTDGCAQAFWAAPTGADSGTVYEVLAKSTVDWCNLASFGPFNVVATTTGTTSVAVSLQPNLVYLVYVKVQGCTTQTPYQQFVDTFTTPPSKPVASVQKTGADVTVTYSQSDARTGRVSSIERATAGGAFQKLPFGPPPPQVELGNYCPVGSQKTYVDPNVPAGSYQYRVVITGNRANPADIPSDPASIVIGGASCTVSCTASAPSTGVAGQGVSFSGSATPSASCSGSTSYSWDFGDGTSSLQQSPLKTYANAGTYSWKVTASVGTPAATCTQSGTITIAAACALSCQANVPTSVNVGQSVTFQGTASPSASCSSGAATYSWDFGDGTSSLAQSPQKVYSNSGTFQWKLQTTVPNGGSPVTCVASGSIAVAAPETCTVQCSANVPTMAAPAETVTFSGSAVPSASCTGAPRYTWDFGDGTSSLEQNPLKAYPSAGTYAWQLSVTIPGSESTATCLSSGSISITSPSSCTVSCAANVPTAAGLSQAVAFQGTATPSAGCSGAPAYSWDFGDGTTSAQQNPQKTYTSAGTFTWRLNVTVASASQASCQASGTIAVSPSACVTPLAPVLGALPASVPSGRSISISWAGTGGVVAGVGFVFETSRDGFRTIETSQSTRNASAVVTTTASPDDYTLSFRVKAVADCGAESPFSGLKSLTVLKLSATFFLTRGSLALTAVGKDAAPGFVSFRNIGAAAGSLSISAPPEGFVVVSPGTLTLQPGEEGTFTVTPNPSVLGGNGFSQGVLVADGQSLGVSLSAVAGPQPKVTLKPSVSSVLFSAVEGTNPAPQTITINIVSQSSAGTVILSPSIGPGGAWLSIVGGPVVAGAPIMLRVDRSRRTREEGVAPFRTLVRFTPVGGDAAAESAVVEVIDNEIGSVTSGAGARGDGDVAAAPPGGTSFIVTTAVGAPGVTSTFTSDGWLRNLSASATTADLFFTPDHKDGLVDAEVLRTAISLPPGTTVRLSDMIGNRFQTSGAGQVEVRSERPHDLTLRTRVDSVSSGDPGTRYGGEIPTVAYRSGTSLGGPELVLPDISDDAANRANLILTETSGAPVTVAISLYDAAGRKLGIAFRVELKAYSKEQLNRIVNVVSPGATLSGGWAGVTVVSGSGRVAVLATVIDNRSGSFSAVLGKGTSGELASRSPNAAAVPRVYVIPSAVRTIGAYNTQFLTSLSLVNGTASSARLSLTYHYVDLDDGNAVKTAQKSLTIIARGSFAKAQGADVIRTFFGVSNRSYGYFTIEGDVGKVVGSGAISAQVDPDDPSKGLRTAQVNGTFLDAPEVIGRGDSETRFAGAERTVQKRTNLVLLELAGQPVNVLVRLVSTVGALLAERVVSVGAGQYFQINDLFGDEGVRLGEGPFQNMEVTAQVLDGTGRIVAVATVNDNISRNPEIFLLKAPGPGGSTVGF